MAEDRTRKGRKTQQQIMTDIFDRVNPKLIQVLPRSFHAAPNAKFSAKDIMGHFAVMCNNHLSPNGLFELVKKH